MPARHSLVREGIVTGVIGAAITAVWYFIVDLLAGRPLHTPEMIGQLILHGPHGVVQTVSPAAVLVATLAHGAAFVVVGIVLTALVHLASRHIAWRMGVLIGVVVAVAWTVGIMFAIEPATGEHFQSWVVIAGGLLSVAGMIAALWRAHPALARSFDEVPLGDETESAPHPPAR